MPVLNEAAYIEAAVASILGQDYPGPTELVLALGPSTDATDEIVTRLQRADPRIHAVQNPRVDIPIGLNRAVAATRYPVIVRVDAHTELPAGYTRGAVATLQQTGAVNVGGVMVAKGRPGLQAAVAWAYNSPLGLGGGTYHHTGEPAGEAESAYLGVMRAEALAEIGGFDETLRRGEDWELNHRFRLAGHRVWFDPSLQVTYWPRSSWRALARQFYATGVWRGELVRRLHRRNSPRFFAPPVLVVVTGAAAALAPVAVAGVGAPAVAWVAGVLAAGPAAYLLLLAAVAAGSDGSLTDRLRRCGVLTVMHYCWGTGLLVGSLRGGRHVVDTSRIPVQPSQPSA